MTKMKTLVSGVAGAMGSRLARIEATNTYFFVENGGFISRISLRTGELERLGAGFEQPQDLEFDEKSGRIFISQYTGSILQLQGDSDFNPSNAKIIAENLKAPQQLALDPIRNRLYFVEYDAGQLSYVDLDTREIELVCSELLGAVGLVLDRFFKNAYISLHTVGKIVSVNLISGKITEVVSGLKAPFMLSWSSTAKKKLLVTERELANRISVVDLIGATPQHYTLIAETPERPSSAVFYREKNRLIVACGKQLVSYRLEHGLNAPISILLPATAFFLGTYHRVPLNLGTTGLVTTDIEFRFSPPTAATVSYCRDTTTDPNIPEIMLLIGSVVGPVTMTAVVRATGTVLAQVSFAVTTSWQADYGPSFWGLGEFTPLQTGSAWGGGDPGHPQNVNVTPALGVRRVALVLVDTSSGRYTEAEAADTAIRAIEHFNRAAHFYRESSFGQFSLVLAEGIPFVGPINLPDRWEAYFEPIGVTPNAYKPKVITSFYRICDAAVRNVLGGVEISSFIFFVKSPDTRFAWPYGSIGSVPNIDIEWNFNLIVPFPVPHLNIFAWVFMPHDWNSHSSREIYETVSHEIGHNIGLPDLYMRGGAYTPEIKAREITEFDLMAFEGGLPHHSLVNKLMLGWIRPEKIRLFNFVVDGSVDIDVELHAAELPDAPEGRFYGVEVRIASGWNYYFEYRIRQMPPGSIGDTNLPDARAVVGTDVISPFYSSPDPNWIQPILRSSILKLADDLDADGSTFDVGQNYIEMDTTVLATLVDFRMTVLATESDHARINIHYDMVVRPELAIRPWPGGGNWRSPDIEVQNPLNPDEFLFSPERDVPLANADNLVKAFVQNLGGIAARGVQVDFFIKDFNLGGNPPETLIGSDLKDIPPGERVEFTVSWRPTNSGHHCIIVKILPYQDPNVPDFVDINSKNNVAQSNYFALHSSHASPASREVLDVLVNNPYAERTEIQVVPQQNGTNSRFYRVYLEKTSVWLDPGESQSVQVMVESLIGEPGPAGVPEDIVEDIYKEPIRVSFTGMGLPPEGYEKDSFEIIGGVELAVFSGRKTRFETFDVGKNQVSGRVITLRGEPARGTVFLKFELESSAQEWLRTNLGGDGTFTLVIPEALKKFTTVQGYYAGPAGYGPCQSEIRP